MERLPIKILQLMFDHKKFSDIELISGRDGKRISAHKIVLSNATEYFDLMLYGSDREVSQSEVLVPDIDSDVLEAVIKFIYYGSVEISDCDAAIQLMKTSHLMKIPELLSYSSDYLKQHISVEICLEVYLLALQFELEDLTKHVTSAILKDLESISKQQEFKQLDKESLVNIINSRNESSCEDDIAEAVLIWIGDEEDRLPYFKELLRSLKINHLIQEFIINQLLKRCEDQDEINFIMNEWKRPKTQVICIEKVDLKYKVYEYELETKRTSMIDTPYDWGQIMGLWDDKLVFLGESVVSVVDIKNKSINDSIYVIESTAADFVNQYKIGSHIYLLDRYNCIRLRLWDFQLETISPPGNEDQFYLFDSFCEFYGELKIAAYKKNDPNICVIISYNPENDSWDYGSEYLLFQVDERGTMVAHRNRIYYFKREFLHIYNPYEGDWCAPILLKQLVIQNGLSHSYSSVEHACSINGQLIIRNSHSEIFKYSDGELTKLNVRGSQSDILKIIAK